MYYDNPITKQRYSTSNHKNIIGNIFALISVQRGESIIKKSLKNIM